MKKQTTKRLATLITLSIFAMAIFFAPTTAEAKWKDNSGDLPGMNEFPTTLVLVAGGLAVAGTIYYLVKKSKNNKDEVKLEKKNEVKVKEEESTETSEPESDSIKEETEGTSSNMDQIEKASFGFYVDVDQVNDFGSKQSIKPDFSDLQVNIGVTLGF